MAKKNEVVKKKKDGRGKTIYQNSNNKTTFIGPHSEENMLMMKRNMAIFALPEIDINDVVQVKARIEEYFRIVAEYKSRPTVTGLAMALKIDRRRLYEIQTGNFSGRGTNDKWHKIPKDVINVVHSAYMYMEVVWEDYMTNGTINPVSGIFLGKNNFGYRDVNDYVVTPTSAPAEIDAESIRKRYEAPEIEGDSKLIEKSDEK